jgi:autotransporter translocation and assembly factor TamB
MRGAFRFAWGTTLLLLHVTVLLGFVTVVLLLALSAGFERSRLRSLIESSLERVLAGSEGGGLRVRVGALEGPLYPEFWLRDVMLSDGAATVLQISQLHVHFDLRSLFGRRLLILDALRVRGLETALERDSAGHWTWTGFGATAPKGVPGTPSFAWPALPVEIQLRSLAVEEGRITLRSAPQLSPTALVVRANLLARDIVLPRMGRPPWPGSADLKLDLETGLVEGRTLEGGELALRLDGSFLRLDSSHLESRFGRARIEGQADLAAWFDPLQAGSLAIKASWESLDCAVLFQRPELAGKVSGRLELEGTHLVDTPLSASRFRAMLAVSRSELAGVRIEAADFQGSYDAGRWELAAASLRASGVRIQGSGRGDLDRFQRFDLDASADDLSRTAILLGFQPEELAGRAQLSAKLSGEFSRPQGRVDLVADGLRVRNKNLGGARAQIVARGDGRIRVDSLAWEATPWRLVNDGPMELRLEQGGLTFERARFELPGHGSGSVAGRLEPGALHGVRLELQGLAVRELAAQLWDKVPLAGVLGLSVRADGPLSRPSLSGSATWDAPRIDQFEAKEVSLDFGAAPPEAMASVRITLTGGETLTGTFSTAYEDAFDPLRALEQPATRATLRGRALDLALADPWLNDPVRDLRGSASFELALQGGLPEPEISGELTIQDGSFGVPMLGRRLGPLEARIKVEPEALQIETASLAGGRGSASLSGKIALRGVRLGAADLRLVLAGFEVRREPDFTGRLDGSIQIEGPPEGLGIRGKVVLNEGRLQLASRRDPLFREIRVRQLSAAPTTSIREGLPAKLGVFEKSSVDLRLEVPRDTWIVGQGAHVEIEGAIEAHKTPSQPLLALGGIDVVQGRYRLQGRMFQIQEGHAVFSGRASLDPALDVLAKTQVRDVKIFARIAGTASAPTLRLESDPAYPQNDVLALLLFGRTSDSLAQPEAAALPSFVAGAAGGALLNQIGEAVGPGHLPLDTLSVGPAATGSGTSVGVGRYLTRDIYLHYDHDVGESQTGRVRVDWRLTKRFSLESRTSSDGNASADLIWTYDY